MEELTKFISMIKSYDKELLTEDLQSGEKIYLFFRNAGCGPCKRIEPAIEKVANDFDDIFYIIEAFEAKDLQRKRGCSRISYFIYITGR